MGIDDIKNCLKIVELQREFAVRLHLLHERRQRELVELEHLKNVAQSIALLKREVGKELLSLSEEEKKEANKLLFERHLKI